MEFRDYAAKETTALLAKLIASQAEASVHQLQRLREALDVAFKGIEASAVVTPQADEETQELIRRLNTAAGAAARAASQKVQKEAQATLDGVNAELAAQREEHDREREAHEQTRGSLRDAESQIESLRADVQKETERAEQADRDLDAAIEAHSQVDAARLEAESNVRQLTAAKTALEQDLTEARGLLDATVSDAARIERELEAARNEVNSLHETMSSERAAADRARDDAQIALDGVNNELRAEREQGDRLSASLAEVESQVEALRGELSEAQAQMDVVRAELQKETERAEQADRDLDAAIEAHTLVDAQRVEAEATARQAVQAKSAIEKDLGEVRGLLDASVAQAARLGMQLDASLAENRQLAADLSAAQSELDAARMQREAIQAQLDATRARVQTMERNKAAQEEHVRQLEKSLSSARQQATSVDVHHAEAQADVSALRSDVDRLSTLLDASSRAVDDLSGATTVADLLGALVRQLSGEFSRVALFRVKANRLEGEHQVGFDLTTDVSKLVIPLSVDSLITRAAASGTIEHLTGDELKDSSRVPFGGTPTVALALPIAFQGETLAVVYADSEQSADSSRVGQHAGMGYALLLVRTTSVLLMRLSQELKTLNELRDYAAMLLQEAREMYSADMQADKGAEERRSRLKDTIECARQLYAQRASLEGSAAATLLDDRIAAAIEAEPKTPFGKDLTAIAGNTVRHSAAS